MNKTVSLVAVLTLFLMLAMVFFLGRHSGVTVHLAGDSTMSKHEKSIRPLTGWGEPFASMVCDGARVKNRARNGRSTKSYVAEDWWQDLLADVRAGDIVLIQFGHNDQKVEHPSLYTNPWLDYRDNLQSFVLDVRAHDAEPVLLTSLSRRFFNSQGEAEHTLGDYPDVTRAVAAEMGVKLIDLNVATLQLIAEMGPDASKQLFVHLAPGVHENFADGKEDDTHLSKEGALSVATLGANALSEFWPDLICVSETR